MKQLCQIIQNNGKEDNGTITITFGDLFEVEQTNIFLSLTFDCLFLSKKKIYTNVSDKLVGVLKKARKHGYLAFEGEMLLQNRDENVIIHFIRSH